MTLEPKHIAPYLPYGLNFQCIDIESGEYEELPLTALILTDGKQDLIIGNQECDIDDLFANEYEAFYPILRPLSDLTKEIEVNGEKFVPIIELAKLFHICKSAVTHFSNIRNAGFYGISVNCNIENDDGRFTYYQIRNEEFVLSNTYEEVQKLFEWHFDVFGLIEQGLAIDFNTLER